MFRLIRVLLVSVPLLFVFLVAPSAFAQSWISAVTATKTTTTATITWTTAVPANSQIAYGTTTSYGSSSALNSNLVTAHSAALTSLAAGTTYHYRVLSADSTGVMVTGLDNVFTTPAAAIGVSVSPTTATVASGGTAAVLGSSHQHQQHGGYLVGHLRHREHRRTVYGSHRDRDENRDRNGYQRRRQYQIRQRHRDRKSGGRHSDAESYKHQLRQRHGRPDEPCPDQHLNQHGECFVDDYQRFTFRRGLPLGRNGHLQLQHAGSGSELYVQRKVHANGDRVSDWDDHDQLDGFEFDRNASTLGDWNDYCDHWHARRQPGHPRSG